MSGSLREIWICRVHVVSLVGFGSQISDLQISGYIAHHVDGRNIGSDWSKVLIGMNLGFDWLRLMIIWFLWDDYFGSQSNLKIMENRIPRLLFRFQRSRESAEIEKDLFLEAGEMSRMVLSESSVYSADLLRSYYRRICSSFLFLHPWRRLRVMGMFMGKDLVFTLSGFGSHIISVFWHLLVHKERICEATQSSLSFLVFVSSIIFCLGVSFSDLWGFSVLSVWSCLLCENMSQSYLLGKDSVEKSLGAVVSKLRIKIPSFDNSALIKGAVVSKSRCFSNVFEGIQTGFDWVNGINGWFLRISRYWLRLIGNLKMYYCRIEGDLCRLRKSQCIKQTWASGGLWEDSRL